jgi:hypothetical protein
MPGIGAAPVGSMAAEDVSDLQPRAAHGRPLDFGSRPPLDQRCQPVEWAGYGPDRRIGDAGVKRRGVELGMTQRTRAIMLPFYVIEIESSAEWDPMLASSATLSARDTRPGPPP